MSFKKKIVFIACISVCIGCLTTLLIYSFKPNEVIVTGLIPARTEQELILDSDIIISGTVQKIEKSKWSNPDNEMRGKRNVLQTDIIIDINELLSGNYYSKTTTVRINKGYDSITRTRYISDGYPDFSVGENVLLFLSRDDGDLATDEDYFVITGMRQGKFILNDDKTLKRDNNNYTIKTISELKQRIITEKKNNPDWKEKRAAQAEQARIQNAQLFGE